MIAFGHSSVGAIIGAGVAVTAVPTTPLAQKLIVVIILGLLSHYVFDAIPHGHYEFEYRHIVGSKNFWIFTADTVGAFALLSLVAFSAVGLSASLLLVIVGMAAALLPDIWEAGVRRKVIPASWLTRAHHRFHFNVLHWHNYSHPHLKDGARAWSISDTWQVVVLIVALLLLTTLPQL